MPENIFPKPGDPGTITVPIPNPGPPTQPTVDVTHPIIHVDARIRLFQDLRRKLFPGEIRSILGSALMGDLFNQEMLFQLMFDSWPRLQKNLRELTSAVSRIKYVVTPYKEENADNATPSATEKSDTVRRALWGMKPIVTRSEEDFEGMVKGIVEASLTGITVQEILWELRPAPKGGSGVEYMPRALLRVPAKFYRYPYALDQLDELLLNPTGDLNGINLIPWPEHKFLISMMQGHPGHPTISMALRCLAALWAGNVFGLEWFCTNAQLFGIPFRKGTFEKGDTEGYNLLMSMLAQMGSAGYAALPVNTNVEFIMAPGAGGVGPAERLIELSDRICDIFILGQTLSTDVGNSGSRALGQVHAQVKEDVMEATADFACRILKSQLVPALMMLNYGSLDEMPDIEPDMEKPTDELGLAQRDVLLFGPGPAGLGIPITLKYLYERHKLPEPEPKDKLYKIPEPPVPPMIGGGENGKALPPGKKPAAKAQASEEEVFLAQLLEAAGVEPLPAFDEEYHFFDNPEPSPDDADLESLAAEIIAAINAKDPAS